jgi:hypothetical protein
MPTGVGIVGPIASVSSSKPLTAKPDAVNCFDLAGKVAVKCVEPASVHPFARTIRAAQYNWLLTYARVNKARPGPLFTMKKFNTHHCGSWRKSARLCVSNSAAMITASYLRKNALSREEMKNCVWLKPQ